MQLDKDGRLSGTFSVKKNGFYRVDLVAPDGAAVPGSVQYAIEGQQLYVFTFVAPAEEQAQWQPTAQAVMNAIVLKK